MGHTTGRTAAQGAALALVLALAACGSGGDPAGDLGSLDSGLADPGEDPGGLGDPGGDVPDGDAPDRDGVEQDTRCPDGFVFIDFPCMSRWRCDGPRAYRDLRHVSCLDAGYDPECCSGASCDEGEPVACPEGTLCVDTANYSPPDHPDPCRPLDCGRPEDLPCPAEDFCATAPGECGAAGVCVRGFCIEGVGREGVYHYGSDTMAWQCGCDGVTYRGDCQREAARTSFAALEPCCDPARLDLTKDNAAGFTNWVACMIPDWQSNASVPPDVQKMIQYLPRYTLAEPLGCQPGEVGITGDTYVHIDDPPEKWLALCRLATTPGVRIVFGTVGPAAKCEDVPCFTGRSCRENTCPTPCGCCPCTGGAKACGDDRVMQNEHLGIITCVGGCFGDPEWCGAGRECVAGADGPRCEDTCAQLASAWSNVPWNAGCQVDGDCRVVSGRCDLGMGPCWLPFAPDEFVTEATLDDLVSRWLGLGCGAPKECDCIAPPTAKCSGGMCALDLAP